MVVLNLSDSKQYDRRLQVLQDTMQEGKAYHDAANAGAKEQDEENHSVTSGEEDQTETMQRDQPSITPRQHDILLGRGKTRNDHPGNQRFRAIIHLNLPRYVDISSCKTKKKGKSKLVDSIVEDLRREGCRFLKQDEETSLWYDVSNEKEAKRKVGHALRDASNEMFECLEREDRCHTNTYFPSLRTPLIPQMDSSPYIPASTMGNHGFGMNLNSSMFFPRTEELGSSMFNLPEPLELTSIDMDISDHLSESDAL